MAYIAKLTVEYQTKPGTLFKLVKGEEVNAIGFDLEDLLRAGVVKEKNLIDKVKEKLSTKEETEEESAAETPKKRGRPKKA